MFCFCSLRNKLLNLIPTFFIFFLYMTNGVIGKYSLKVRSFNSKDCTGDPAFTLLVNGKCNTVISMKMEGGGTYGNYIKGSVSGCRVGDTNEYFIYTNELCEALNITLKREVITEIDVEYFNQCIVETDGTSTITECNCSSRYKVSALAFMIWLSFNFL